jgi:hypothetical protein
MEAEGKLKARTSLVNKAKRHWPSNLVHPDKSFVMETKNLLLLNVWE